MGALRAFEATARLNSFTRAAAELNISQSAVSQAVRQLEAMLGAELFSRGSGGLNLTPIGRRYAASIGAALDAIGEATRATAASRRQLTISCARSFLQKWLLARLQQFRTVRPTLELQVTGIGLGEPFELSEVNILAAAVGEQPAGASLLAEDRLILVANSRLAIDIGSRLEKLGDVPRIDGFSPVWDAWCAAADVPIPTRATASVLRLREATAIIQAAIEGHGIGLVSELLSRDDVRSGRLIKLAETSIPRRRAYWLLMRSQSASEAARAFAAWIQQSVTTPASLGPDAVGTTGPS